MKIQFNTDKNVNASKELSVMVTAFLSEELRRFNYQITKLEVHLSDEDGPKKGHNDKRCMLEARLEGMQPIAVTDYANTHEQALIGATDKLKSSLETILGRLRNY